MDRRTELICWIDALALNYFNTWYMNDGKEIIDAFEEYIDIIQDEKTIDKRVMCSAYSIITTFERERNRIQDKFLCIDAEEMYMYLKRIIWEWRPQYLQEMYRHGIYSVESAYKKIIEKEKN